MNDHMTFLDEAMETPEQARERAAARDRALAHRQLLVRAMAGIMASHGGRELVRWLLASNFAFEARFDDDLARAQYREGRRHVAMDVLRLAQEAGVADKLLQSEELDG